MDMNSNFSGTIPNPLGSGYFRTPGELLDFINSEFDRLESDKLSEGEMLCWRKYFAPLREQLYACSDLERKDGRAGDMTLAIERAVEEFRTAGPGYAKCLRLAARKRRGDGL